MSVFNGTTKIGRAVKDPMTDKALPSPGALSWGAITSPTALAGTTGADAKLVQGDQWDQVVGNMTENFTGNVKTSVLQNRTETVTLNHDETVIAGFKQTVIGQYNRTIIGPQMTSNIAPRNSTYVAPYTELVASALVMNGGPLYEWKFFKGGMYGIQNNNVGATVTLYVQKSDIGIHKLDVPANQTVVSALACDFKGLENKGSGFSNFLEGLRNWATGFQSRLKAMEAKVGPDVQGPPTSLGGN